MESNIYNFYKDITNRHTLNDISSSLGVNKGTIKRWELLKEVPPQYYFDLCRLDGIQVDYTNYTEKEKDQFTKRLKDLSDEEREIENLMKNHKCGQYTIMEMV